jgi:hypothetical protein
MAYRRQRVAETTTALDRERWQATSAHDRTRLLNERFTTIAAQLGDGQAAVRLAGVHAMTGLADDWKENRQTCIDVLCAYLRMPYEPDPGEAAPAGERLGFRASREVRHTVIRVITAHLREHAPMSWQGMSFDFSEVVFDGGDFSGAKFSGGTEFNGATFSSGYVAFNGTEFSRVSFLDAKFSGSTVGFSNAKFSGTNFIGAEFSDGDVAFHHAKFSGGNCIFMSAKFSGSKVSFLSAKFSGGTVGFSDAEFSGGTVGFFNAKFSGGEVDFGGAKFSGGTVDFSRAADWSHPPKFDWEDRPPQGVKLPAAHHDES